MLPAYPWDIRDADNPLTVEEVCSALVETEGNIYLAADRLKVGSLILRKFVERSTRARAVIREMAERLAEEAQTTLHQALRDEDARRQDWAVRYILNSKNAKKLGWASSDPAEAASQHHGPLINLTVQAVEWADGTKIGPPAGSEQRTIDVTPAKTVTDDGRL